jgi:N-acetylglucosamine kinase-like BadF-type ATPase
VLDALALERPEELIRWAYDDIAWARFAQLAPLAVGCAERGDAVAAAILEQAADDLAIAVLAVAHQLEMQGEPCPLVLTGSNLQPGRLAALVTARLQVVLPQATIIHPSVEPAIGAALLALLSIHNL